MTFLLFFGFLFILGAVVTGWWGLAILGLASFIGWGSVAAGAEYEREVKHIGKWTG